MNFITQLPTNIHEHMPQIALFEGLIVSGKGKKIGIMKAFGGRGSICIEMGNMLTHTHTSITSRCLSYGNPGMTDTYIDSHASVAGGHTMGDPDH